MLRPSNRKWSVLIEVERGGQASVWVAINGRALLPTAHGSNTPAQALAYAESALADARSGDIIEGTVRGSASSLLTFTVGSPSVALFWLKETLQNVASDRAPRRTERSSGHDAPPSPDAGS